MNKVLVIDDEELIVKSTCMALKFYGFESKGLLDGMDALQETLNFKPDIILLDIIMPGIDGWQVLSELKSENTIHKIPVIIFTAKEHLNAFAMVRKKGAEDYIAKPFEPLHLIEVIKKYVNKMET